MHRQLRDWIAHAGEWHEVVRSSKNGKSSTLYTDATLESWGAVYITDDGRVYATGAKFDDEQRVGDIGRKEGFAVVNALRCFSSPLNDISRLNLFVDNTSVGSAVARYRSPGTSATVAVAPARIRRSVVRAPIRRSSSRRTISSTPVIGSSSSATTMSPGRTPACAAGLPDATSMTRTPLAVPARD